MSDIMQQPAERQRVENDVVTIDPALWRWGFIVLAVFGVLYLNIKALSAGRPELALIVFIALVLLIWGIANPKTILYWVLVYYVFAPILTSIQPRGAQVGTFTLLLLAGIVVMQGAMGVRQPRRLHPVDYLIFLQVLTLFLSYRDLYGMSVWLWGFKQESKYLVMFILLRYLDLSRHDLRTILRIIMTLAGIIGSYAIIQYLFDYQRLLPFVAIHNFLRAYGGEHESIYAVKRAYSFLLSPLNLGYTMMLASLLGFCMATALPRKQTLERSFLWMATGICLSALVLSFTRSAWGGFGVAALGLLFYRPTRKPALFLGVWGLLVIPVIYAVKPSLLVDFWHRFSSLFVDTHIATSYHFLYLQNSWQYILHTPLGAGLGTATHSARVFFTNPIWTESEILNKGVQCGWLGLGSFIAVLVAITVKGLDMVKRAESPWMRGLGTYIVLSTTACCFAGLTGLVWGSWVASSWYWMVAAIAFTLHDKAMAARASEETVRAPRSQAVQRRET